MAKIHNPKSRPKASAAEHAAQGLELLKGQGKPTCADRQRAIADEVAAKLTARGFSGFTMSTLSSGDAGGRLGIGVEYGEIRVAILLRDEPCFIDQAASHFADKISEFDRSFTVRPLPKLGRS